MELHVSKMSSTCSMMMVVEVALKRKNKEGLDCTLLKTKPLQEGFQFMKPSTRCLFKDIECLRKMTYVIRYKQVTWRRLYIDLFLYITMEKCIVDTNLIYRLTLRHNKSKHYPYYGSFHNWTEAFLIINTLILKVILGNQPSFIPF